MSIVRVNIPDAGDPGFNEAVKSNIETKVPAELPVYSFQELVGLTAKNYEGFLVRCSNGDGGTECLAYCDGFNWRIIQIAQNLSLDLGWYPDSVGPNNYVFYGDGETLYTEQLQAAIDGLDSGGSLTIHGTILASSVTIDKALRINGNGTIKQIAGAAATNTPFISVTAAGVEFRGITVDGDKANQGVITGAHLIQFGNGADNGVVDRCVFQNSTGICVRVLSADNLRISNSRFDNWQVGNVGAIYIDAVNGDAAINGVKIIGNYVDGSSSNSTGIKVTGNSTRPTYDAITGRNTVVVGDHTGDTLGIEYWSSAGYGVVRGTISSNTVSGENNTNTKVFGISVAGAGCREITVSNNSLNECRQYGLEVAASYKCTITGNAVYQSGTPVSYKPGMTLNECNECLFVGNAISGYQVGIHVYSQDFQTATSSDNIISNNSVTLKASTAGYAIWVQCNDSGASVKRNFVTGNKIIGDGTTSQYGVVVQQDSGSLDDTVISNNKLYDLPVGVSQASDTNTKISNNFYNTVTTLLGGTPGSGRFAGLFCWDAMVTGTGSGGITGPTTITGVTAPTVIAGVIPFKDGAGTQYYIPLLS